MVTVAQRVAKAQEAGLAHTTLAWCAFEGSVFLAWNCAGEQVEIDWRNPQLSVLTQARRNIFAMERWGGYIQWGLLKFNPFMLCETCNRYHHNQTHTQWKTRQLGE